MTDWAEENDGPPGEPEAEEPAAGGWEETQESPHEGEEGQAGDVA